MSINGNVVDSRTRKPLAGAKVTVMDINNKISTYTTDADGKFKHYAEWGKDYFLTLEKSDYKNRKEKITTKTASPTDDYEVTIDLEKELIYAAYGIVKDAANGQIIPGAEVRIIGEGPERSVITDNDGRYFSSLEPENDYSLIVSKPGYMPEIISFSTRGKTDPIDFFMILSPF